MRFRGNGSAAYDSRQASLNGALDLRRTEHRAFDGLGGAVADLGKRKGIVRPHTPELH